MSTSREDDAGGGDISEYSIEIGLDWGTCKWAAAYAVSRNGKQLNPPVPLKISNKGHEVPMKATWHGDRLIQGFELEGLANKDRALSNKIVDHFKLGLYEGPEVSSIISRMEKILADIPGKDYDALVTDHMQAVIAQIKDSIRLSPLRSDYSADHLGHMLSRLLVRITVPQMWTPDARRHMQDAAKRAGLRVVVLACEPQCALAYLVHKLAQRVRPLAQTLGKGNIIAIIDAGAGTGDFAAFSLSEQLSTSSRLKPIGESSGELCGGFRVDQILYDTLKNKPGNGSDWVVNSSLELEVGERDFERRALEAIEIIKQNFRETDTIAWA